jgi:hypothetical protein
MPLSTSRRAVIKERAAIVRRVFRMLLDGIGKDGIAKRLNADKVPTFSERGDGWHTSYITKLLDNPAVYGTYQPHRVEWDEKTGARRRVPDGEPIENYFPAAVDRETYRRT